MQESGKAHDLTNQPRCCAELESSTRESFYLYGKIGAVQVAYLAQGRAFWNVLIISWSQICFLPGTGSLDRQKMQIRQRAALPAILFDRVDLPRGFFTLWEKCLTWPRLAAPWLTLIWLIWPDHTWSRILPKPDGRHEFSWIEFRTQLGKLGWDLTWRPQEFAEFDGCYVDVHLSRGFEWRHRPPGVAWCHLRHLLAHASPQNGIYAGACHAFLSQASLGVACRLPPAQNSDMQCNHQY